MKDNLCSNYITIFVVVSCYWIVSILTVFVNKKLLSNQDVPFQVPLFVTWFQCVVSYTICNILSYTGGIKKVVSFPKGTPWSYDNIKKIAYLMRKSIFKIGQVQVGLTAGGAVGKALVYNTNVIPLSIMFTLMIASNNLCLKYVGVSFYFIGRSLTTVFNVVLSWVLLRQATSLRCIMCCAFIIFGFYLGVDQEKALGSFSLLGTVFGILGSLSLSLYSIYTKKVLPLVDNEVCLLSYYNNAYAIILFIPLIIYNGEIKELWTYKHLLGDGFYWFQMVIGGLCGFAIGYFTSLQIKVTSPLTHNVSGTAKACAQTVLATQWYNETKNLLWWTSNIIVLASSALYARFKQLEMEERSKRTRLEEKQNLEKPDSSNAQENFLLQN